MRSGRPPPIRVEGLKQLRAPEIAAALAASVAGVYFLTTNVVEIPHDFTSIWRGVHTFSMGASPYVRHSTTNSFVFAPSAAILLWPEAASRTLSAHLWGLVNLALLCWLALGTWWATRDEHIASPRAWCWSMLAVALFLCGRMGRGNYDIVTAGLILASLILVSGRFQDRWGRFGRTWAAGVALGLAIAVKLTAVPTLLIFMLLGEWVATALAVAIPLVLSGLAILRVHQMTRWVSWTLPYLRQRLTPVRSADVSFQALFSNNAASHVTLWAAIGVVLIAAVMWISKLWRSDRPRHVSTLVLVAGLCSVVLSLSTPGSFGYYWVYALPAVVVVGRERIPAGLVVVGLAGLALPETLVHHVAKLPGLRQVADTRSLLAFLLLAAALAVALVRGPDDQAGDADSTEPTSPASSRTGTA
jgi:arabinofuranan 3-O-arabinosyltransferase